MILLLGMAAAVPACRSDGPALTLVFVGLDGESGSIVVTLSQAAGARGFAGTDASDDGVAVSYPGDGTIVIAMDRGTAAGHGDRVRLPLTAPQVLSLRGAAAATQGGRTLRATAEASVEPGQAVTLTFDFGGVGDAGADESTDAPLADGRDAGEMNDGAEGDHDTLLPDGPPPDATPDANSPDLTPPDRIADRAPDAVAIPSRCVAATPRPASVAQATGGPALGFASSAGLFGVVWNGAGGVGLYYNAVDATGTLKSATADVTIAVSGTVGTPRLADLGSDLALAFGQRDTTGRAQAMLARLAPASGALRAAPTAASSAVSGSSLPMEVGAIALGGGAIAVISRPPASAASAAEIDLFADSGGPSPLFVTRQSPTALGATRATALGWVASGGGAGKFFGGALSDASATGGTLVAFGGADLALGVSFPFTAGGDAPAIGNVGATASVAGVGDRLAVAWVDGRGCAGCASREIFLTIVDQTGVRPFGEIQVAEPNTTGKSYPHVVFDGQAIAVAWLEYESTTSSRVRLRRFDTTLAPVGAVLDVSPNGAAKPAAADIDLVVAAPGEYGVVMALAADRQSFTHVTCTGN